jgi:hypothetical protein
MKSQQIRNGVLVVLAALLAGVVFVSGCHGVTW